MFKIYNKDHLQRLKTGSTTKTRDDLRKPEEKNDSHRKRLKNGTQSRTHTILGKELTQR